LVNKLPAGLGRAGSYIGNHFLDRLQEAEDASEKNKFLIRVPPNTIFASPFVSNLSDKRLWLGKRAFQAFAVLHRPVIKAVILQFTGYTFRHYPCGIGIFSPPAVKQINALLKILRGFRNHQLVGALRFVFILILKGPGKTQILLGNAQRFLH